MGFGGKSMGPTVAKDQVFKVVHFWSYREKKLVAFQCPYGQTLVGICWNVFNVGNLTRNHSPNTGTFSLVKKPHIYMVAASKKGDC